jgi:mono/diheme cytochrome c family protein
MHVEADGDLELPVGSVLVKRFIQEGDWVETRLLMHHSSGDWAGYTYLPDGSGDAVLALGGGLVPTVGAPWSAPSSGDCLACHTVASGRTLGLELRQLNRSVTYPSTGQVANQVATLDAIGMFDGPLGGPPPQMPAPGHVGASLHERASAYLHANCAHCHQPGGTASTPFDLRFSSDLISMGVCDTAPVGGDLGIVGAAVLVPGNPDASLLAVRMAATDHARMPPLGTFEVDQEGVELIRAWIEGIGTCP